MSLRTNGLPDQDQLTASRPSPQRLARGPVAIFECFERIPCNPCFDACPTGAVLPFADINDIPKVDFDLCTGCGNCIAACPGLAIFVVDETFSTGEALLKIPYEFSPLPERGETIQVLNRAGREVGQGKVVRIQKGRNKLATPLVWLTVPKGLAQEVRHLARYQ
ncbi:MAG: 4Fe-4S binding protein [Firmicutes bacterium]|nr:4Fe-4S binding protein [Bacillota bacterium]MCL5038985.1 4Fe-4S binding protein [Bacillota bacterium]